MEHETRSTAREFLRPCELFCFFNRIGGTEKLYPIFF